MAANKFASRLHKKTNKLTFILVYVILEWILILLLLLNSLYSYLIIKFVDYFGLKRPCIWCSRLDHVFEPQKYKNLHRDLVCENHATEISKLGYCSDHRKLAEVEQMCEDCSQWLEPSKIALFRWVKRNGITCEVDLNCSCCDVGLNDKFYSPCVLIKPSWDSDYTQKDKSVDEEAVNGAFLDESTHLNLTKADRCINDGDEDYDRDDNIEEGDDIEVTKNQIEIEAGENHLLAIESTELIKRSYSEETMIEFSTEATISEILHQADRSLSGKIIALMNRESQIAYSDIEEKNTMGCEWYLEKEVIELEGNENDESKFAMMVTMQLEENEDYLIFHAIREDTVMEVDEQLDNSQSNQTVFNVYDDVQATMGDLAIDMHEQVAIAQATEAASEVEITTKDSALEIHEQAVDTHATETESNVEDHVQAIVENLVMEVQVQDVITHAAKTAFEVEDHIQSPMGDLVIELLEQVLITRTTETESEVENDNDNDVQSTAGDLVIKLLEQAVITRTTETESEVENDAHKMETLIMEVHGQPVNTETTHTSVEAESTVHKASENGFEVIADPEDPFTTSITDDQGTNQPEDESLEHKPILVTINERAMHIHSTLCFELDEFEEDNIPRTPTSIDDLRNLHRNIDSLDGSVISEFENVEVISTVEKLQSALKADRKVLNALYTELEEERSASAIAASQTMAMINRLQEEKSAMQMESIQYQRMMEEQSEYDQEALQLLNKLMVKREREKQELEKELEISRKRIMEFEMREKMAMMKRIRDSNSSIASFNNAEDSDEQSLDLNHESAQENGSLGFHTTPVDDILHFDESLAQFEEERLSILDQLKVLEAKLFTLDDEDDNKFINVSSYEHLIVDNSENNTSSSFNEIDHHNNQQQQQEEEKRKILPLKPKILLPLFDSLSGETEDEDMAMTTNRFEESRNSLSSTTKSESESNNTNKHAIEEEVDHVYERLHALEADRDFLRHCIESLKKGDRGIDLLQEILLHLRDLRNVDLRVKNIGDSASQ